MTQELHGVYLAWTKKFISLNSWRIEGDFDDCLQEAQIKFIHCQNKYGDVEAPHLMSLFQRSLVRHFHTLSNKRSRFISIKQEYKKVRGPVQQTVNGQFTGEIPSICSVIPTELLEISCLFRFINRMELLLMNIKKELAEACSHDAKDLKALLEAASSMSDEIYEKLSKDAKDWLDDAIDASNAGKALPSLNGSGVTNEEFVASAPKTPSKKSPSKGAVGRHGKFPDTATIEILAHRNPKRKNSNAYQVFALYTDGMTVKEFLEAGGSKRALNWDTDRKFIQITSID